MGGNSNTVCVSKYRLNTVDKHKGFKSTHTASYKQVIGFGVETHEDVTLMSIDTGMNGNLFGGNYFNMNADHLNGRLHEMSMDFGDLERKKPFKALNYKLKLNPAD